MSWAAFKFFFENYGDLLSVVGGPIISIIVSFIQWIIFIIQLAKAGSLEINSLVVVEKDKTSFVGVEQVDYDYSKCYVFEDSSRAFCAQQDLTKVLFEYSIVIGIIWVIVQIVFIGNMVAEVTKKLQRSWQYQAVKQLYFEYFKFLLTIFSNTLFVLINKIEFDQDCVINYPTLFDSVINIRVWIMLGSVFLFVCLVGNICCWYYHENPHFCFTYPYQLIIRYFCKIDSSDKQTLCCCYYIHGIGFLFILFWVIVPTISTDLIFSIPTIIIFLAEVIDITNKYYRLKKNKFEPIKIKSNKIESQTTIPEKLPTQTNTNN